MTQVGTASVATVLAVDAQLNICCVGLGGGMGVFLAQPITSALNEALATSAALSEVRRILELIVPLAYRPPIKVRSLCGLNLLVSSYETF